MTFYGVVPMCSRRLALDHQHGAPTYTENWGICETCDQDVGECVECGAVISCCVCGRYHALECEVP